MVASNPHHMPSRKSASRLVPRKISQNIVRCMSLRLYGDEALPGIQPIAAALLDDLERHPRLPLAVSPRGEGALLGGGHPHHKNPPLPKAEAVSAGLQLPPADVERRLGDEQALVLLLDGRGVAGGVH